MLHICIYLVLTLGEELVQSQGPWPRDIKFQGERKARTCCNDAGPDLCLSIFLALFFLPWSLVSYKRESSLILLLPVNGQCHPHHQSDYDTQ